MKLKHRIKTGANALVPLLLLNVLASSLALGLIDPESAESPESYLTGFINNIFQLERLRHISNPLQMCIPVQIDVPSLMDHVLKELQSAIELGDYNGRKLAEGLKSAVHFSEFKNMISSKADEKQLQLQTAQPADNLQGNSIYAPLWQINASKNAPKVVTSEGKRSKVAKMLEKTCRRIVAASLKVSELTGQQKLAKNYTKFQQQLYNTPGLTGLLDLSDSNELGPQVYRKSTKVDYEMLKRKVEQKVKMLPTPEFGYLQEAILQAYGLTDTAPKGSMPSATNKMQRLIRVRRGLVDNVGSFLIKSHQKVSSMGNKALSGIVMQVIRFGIQILDHLYMSPDFLLNLPMVGKKIIMLRNMGKPLYEIVQVVRNINYLYKVSKCPPLDALQISSAPQPHRDPNDCDEHKVDPQKVEEAKKIVTESGSRALFRIASKVSEMSNSELDEEGMHEFISRTAYTVLTLVLPTSVSCPPSADDLIYDPLENPVEPALGATQQ